MKKVIYSFLMCLIMFILPNFVLADMATKAIVNVTAVRVRDSASTDGKLIKTIYEEDEVEVYEENNGWYKIGIDNTIGYAKKEYFTITRQGDVPLQSESTQQETSTTEQPIGEVVEQPAEENNQVENTQLENNYSLVDNINYNIGENITLKNTILTRIIPSLSAIEKNEFSVGTQVSVEDKKGSWYKVSDGTNFGWVTNIKLNNSLIQVTVPEVVENIPEVAVPENTENQSQESQPQENNVQEPTTEALPESNTAVEEQPTTNKTAIVIVETARVRKSASKTSDIIDTLDEDDIVTILGEEGEFYKISTSSISEGYIGKSLVKDYKVTSRGSNETRDNTVSVEENNAVNDSLKEASAVMNNGESIIEFAKQYLGYPYVLGASSPEKGFDCSGFTRYVFGHFGYKLGQVAAEQTSLGSIVERENLITGDLILFYNEAKTKIGHCGIYIGGGDFIHSANPERGVVIDNLNTNSYYAQRFVAARRIVE